MFGYDEITRQYYDRYKLPVMHTETNLMRVRTATRPSNWLWKQWANVLRVRNDGVPIVGFTWYSLTDQIDWDTALREENNRVNPLGLYDLDRNIRPVGEAYKQLIADWRDVLPAQSVCLTVPLILPSEYDEPVARRRRDWARRYQRRRSRTKTVVRANEPVETRGRGAKGRRRRSRVDAGVPIGFKGRRRRANPSCWSTAIATSISRSFPSRLPEVLAAAEAAGVGRMVTISTHVARVETYRALAEAHDAVFFTVGTHPHNAAEEPDVPAAEIVALSRHPRCVAIGEAGLDYHYDKSPRDVQRAVFRTHIAAARETRPAARHPRPQRRRRHDRRSSARRWGRAPSMPCCIAFPPARRLAEIGVELGFYVSFSGILTFKNSEDIREIAARRSPRSAARRDRCALSRARAASRPDRTSRPMWRIRRACSPTSSASNPTRWRS